MGAPSGNSSGGSISAGQMSQLAAAARKGMESAQSAEEGLSLPGYGSAGQQSTPQMSSSYLDAINKDDERKKWEHMIGAIGSNDSGSYY